MVTAELAVGLPVLTAIVALAVAVVAAVGAHVRCLDAAAGAARLAARGESEATVRTFVAADGPAGAQAALSTRGQIVTVTVTAPLRLPLLGGWLPLRLSAAVSQPLEPDGTAPPAGLTTRAAASQRLGGGRGG